MEEVWGHAPQLSIEGRDMTREINQGSEKRVQVCGIDRPLTEVSPYTGQQGERPEQEAPFVENERFLNGHKPILAIHRTVSSRISNGRHTTGWTDSSE
jgi:hypothetical protein